MVAAGDGRSQRAERQRSERRRQILDAALRLFATRGYHATGVREIVEAAAGDESPLLKEDFYNSLLAAFTLEEVAEQVAAAGLGGLWPAQVSERHWLVSGRV